MRDRHWVRDGRLERDGDWVGSKKGSKGGELIKSNKTTIPMMRRTQSNNGNNEEIPEM